jgi:hypothetical protein
VRGGVENREEKMKVVHTKGKKGQKIEKKNNNRPVE